AQMKNVLCRAAKNRAAVFQNRRVTADHVGKPSLFRSFLAAAHGRVDHFDCIVPTAGGDFSRGGRKDRAVNRHDRSRSRAMNHTALADNNLLRLGVIDDRDFYNVALFRDFLRRSGDPGTDRSERFARLLAQIENRKLEAGFDDVCGHRFSHGAQTYKANLGLHTLFYLKSSTSNKAKLTIVTGAKIARGRSNTKEKPGFLLSRATRTVIDSGKRNNRREQLHR